MEDTSADLALTLPASIAEVADRVRQLRQAAEELVALADAAAAMLQSLDAPH